MTNDEVNVRITGDSTGIASAMRDASGSIRSASSEIREQLGDLYSGFEKLDKGIKELAATTSSTASVIGLSTAMYQTLFDAVRQVGVAMVQSVAQTFRLGTELDKAAAAAGLSAEAMSGLAYVAQESNVSTASLSSGLRSMQQHLSQAEDGSKGVTRALDALGVSIAEIKALRADEQFEMLAQKISEVIDPAERTRIAIDLFGAAGAELLPLFMKGADGIRAAREEAERLHLVLDQDALNALVEADRATKRLDRSLDGLSRTIAVKVAPSLATMADNLRMLLGGANEVETLTARIRDLQSLQDFGKMTPQTREEEIATLQNRRNELTRDRDLKEFDAESERIRKRNAQKNAPMMEEVVVSSPRSLKEPPKTDEQKLLEGFERLPARMNSIDREITANFKQSSRERMAEFDREAKEIVGSTGRKLYDLKETNDNIANDYERTWLARLQPISAAFNKSITGMIMGTQTLRQSVANIGRSIVAEFINMSVQSATAWIAQQIRMAVFQRATAKGNVLSNAAEAGSGAYKAIVGIPYVGPFLAPIAAAAAFAGTVAFGARIPSARQGWSVPTGVNPITQLHEDEMVLPANLSKAVRDMAAGNGGAGGGQPLNVALSIPAIDGASVRRLVGSSEFQRELRGAFQRAGVSVA